MKDDLPHELKRPGYGDHDTPPNDEPTGSYLLWASAPFFIAHERAGDVIDIFWSISDCFFTFLFKPTVHHALDVTAYSSRAFARRPRFSSNAPLFVTHACSVASAPPKVETAGKREQSNTANVGTQFWNDQESSGC